MNKYQVSLHALSEHESEEYIKRKLSISRVKRSSFYGKVRNAYDEHKKLDMYIIPTSNELKSYTEYSGNTWKDEIVYIEHPMIPKCLIPEKNVKNILLREVIADISDYILDSFPVKELTFGIVRSFGSGLGAGCPVNEINVNAHIKCEIAKLYYHHVEDTSFVEKKHNYVWIDSFPEIKSAVSHKAGSMENIVTSSFDFATELGLIENIKFSLNLNKNFEFYISYIKK